MKILLIQHNQTLIHTIQQMLEERQYLVQVATDGVMGLSTALHARFDLLILDTQLPNLDGFDVVQRLRQENDSTPILLLSTRHDPASPAKGLYAGADDYLHYPFNPDELLARIYALHRRRTGGFNAPTVLSVDNLELNVAEKAAYRASKRISLTAREFQLLTFLVENVGRVVTKAQILEKVWDGPAAQRTNKVEVYINFLRKKIDHGFDRKLIHTATGVGYLLRSGL